MRQTTSLTDSGDKVQEETIDSQNARSWMGVIIGLQLNTALHEIPFDECIKIQPHRPPTGLVTNLKSVRAPPCISSPKTYIKIHSYPSAYI